MVDCLHGVRHIHLVGICGTGMASLAGMLQQKGLRVTGSDRNVYPPMSTFLQDRGIAILQGFSESHLRPRPDLVVIGNAVSRGNPEVEVTLDEKTPYRSLPEILKEVFIRGKTSVVVAGTHGKTTTTALLTWLLESAGLRPSFLIGGIARNFNSSFRVADGEHFVIEGDEYDTAFFDKSPKFLHYLPDVVVFNNCEYDHADIYPDFSAVKQSFRRLLNIIPSKGALVAGWDDAVVRKLSADSPTTVISFGIDPAAQWTASAIRFLEQSTRFQALRGGEDWGQFEIPLAGSFNVRNALAALVCAHRLGLSRETIARGFRSFKSVKRRLENRGEVAGITVFDDFAHHPTAIAATLAAIRNRFPKNRVWAIFEPRSATSRRRVFQKAFSRCFADADHVILCSIFAPEKLAPELRLDLDQLVGDLRNQGCDAHCLPSAGEIVEQIAPRLRTGDKVVIMSNGGFDGIHARLLARLSRD
jgi:UDP-N-acetylmuramate: L-alanyl-gamma-D-glutamyl-meso-diaminopimelate ligase